MFSEYKRINITLDERFSFTDFIRSIEEQQLKTATFQKCSHVIKNSEFKDSGLTISHYLFYSWNKLRFAKQFKKTKLNSLIVDFYLKYLSWAEAIGFNASLKRKLNKLFHLHLPLQKPERLRILVNITPSFFIKAIPDMGLTNLKFHYANHFGSEDRPVSNRSLWVLFSKNQEGEYLISINGPVSAHCKDLIAQEFNKVIAKILENDEWTVEELIQG